MVSPNKAIDDYIAAAPSDRQAVLLKLRDVLLKNLPQGFEEEISYGMPGYVVPHSLYPKGYHCSPALPLPFLSFASQKNFIAVYHMGIYADKELMTWFTEEYKKWSTKKLDMGKSCIRFKKPEDIPLVLIAQLAKKMSPKQWIECYERNFRKG